MINDLLKDNIIFINNSISWEDAVRLSGENLIKKGFITNSYIDAIFESVKKNGFYIVISNEVAIPHASNLVGVNKLCMSLLHSSKEIIFGDHDKVKLVFLFATTDNTSHIKVLEELAIFLSNDEKLQNLLQASSEKEILSLFN